MLEETSAGEPGAPATAPDSGPAPDGAAAPDPGPGANEVRYLGRVAVQLREEFPDVPQAVLDAAFACAVAEFEGAPVRVFVPVLVLRSARSRLRTLVDETAGQDGDRSGFADASYADV